MIRRNCIVGLAMLCALVSCAIVASYASAAQRAYTCAKSATTKTFHDAHCIDEATTPKEYGHTLVTAENTKIVATNEKTAAGTTAAAVSKLRGQLAGVVTEVQCTGLHGHGTLINRTTPANHVEGEGVLEYTGCTITAPAGKGCVVTGGSITTNNLFATTEGRAAGLLTITPKVGAAFATFPISGCASEKPPANNYTVAGMVTGHVSGATITTTHSQTTADEELEFGGVDAGIDGALTASMEGEEVEEVKPGGGITVTATAKHPRAYTCSKSATTKTLGDAHCLNEGSEYGRTLVAAENTKVTATNEKTASGTTASTTSKLKGTLSGIVTEVQCTGLKGSGTLTNAAESVNGEGTLEYTGCSVTAPASKGCEVEGGKFTTETLSATTAGQAEGSLKLSPKSPATKFARISIEGCAEALPADGTYPVTGSVVAEVSGATITTTHESTTTQGTLKFGGAKAGLEGASTISMEGGDPIVIASFSEQKAYFCSKSATKKTFGDAHCLNAGSEYGHTLIGEEKAAFTATNEKTASETKAAEVSKLRGQLGGVVTEVQCTGLKGSGTLTNATESVSGEGTLEYTGCTVTAPAGKGCVVEGGKFSTETLSATTAEQAANMVKFTPKSPATKFARVSIEGCAEGVPAEGSYSVTGSLLAEVSGATIKTTHATTTTQGTLKFGGVKAGLEGAATLSKEEVIISSSASITLT